MARASKNCSSSDSSKSSSVPNSWLRLQKYTVRKIIQGSAASAHKKHRTLSCSAAICAGVAQTCCVCSFWFRLESGAAQCITSTELQHEWCRRRLVRSTRARQQCDASRRGDSGAPRCLRRTVSRSSRLSHRCLFPPLPNPPPFCVPNTTQTRIARVTRVRLPCASGVAFAGWRRSARDELPLAFCA